MPANTPVPDVLPDPANEVDHASGIYDPSEHADQLVAVFETTADAQAALDALQQAGIAGDASIIEGNPTPVTEPGGLWTSLKSLFAPDDEMTHYQEGLRRGHALLVAHPTPDTRLQIVHIMEAHHPVDFDARLEEWRAAGWKNLQQQEAATMGAETTAAPGQEAPSASTTAGIAQTDTDVRADLEARANVAGGLVRGYRSN